MGKALAGVPIRVQKSATFAPRVSPRLFFSFFSGAKRGRKLHARTSLRFHNAPGVGHYSSWVGRNASGLWLRPAMTPLPNPPRVGGGDRKGNGFWNLGAQRGPHANLRQALRA
jgi:hypothetical protein